jgi:hypothetical protein
MNSKPESSTFFGENRNITVKRVVEGIMNMGIGRPVKV